ncbi:hypothetical protein KAI87_17135 [Myxococcota bacterium]|nr:hypothetical protein [Myxococcota bacterium]
MKRYFSKSGRAKRSRKLLDDAAVGAVLLSLQRGELSLDDYAYSDDILEALRRSTHALESDASMQELSTYVQGLNAGELEGVANNIKGIAHEIAFVRAENSDGDSVQAELFEDTYHPGSDVILRDSQTGEVLEVQLKATHSSSYASEALERYPDVPVYTTSELADRSAEFSSTHISNTELSQNTDGVLSSLGDSVELPIEGILVAVGLTLVLRGGEIFFRLNQGQQLREVDLATLKKEVGASALRAAVLVALSATPLAPAVALYIAARLGFGALSLMVPESGDTKQPLRKPQHLLTKGRT